MFVLNLISLRRSPRALYWALLAAAGALTLAARDGGAAPHEDDASGSAPIYVNNELKNVKVLTRREGDVTHFYVENKELCEITMTFEMDLVKLKGNAAFPYTATFPAGATTEAFQVEPIAPGAKWSYSYTNYFKLGSNCVRHDDNYSYQLPYAPGRKHHVTQAYGGSFSHKGSNQYAIDWEMPEGTPVFAARSGVVVKTKSDSNRGGSSMKYDRYNNYVLIRHDDGTLGHYCHLQKGGVVVRPGQYVQTGELIAHSGNTGFSSGPHLHFCVFKTRNGRERESIPVKFRTSNAAAITLVGGRTYRAADLPAPTQTSQTTSVRVSENSAKANT